MKRLLLILFISLTFLSLFAEVYTFKYFLFKHYFISTDLLIVLTLIVELYVLKDKDYNTFFLTISKLLFVPLAIIYFYLTYLNNSNYSNYVFSKYHVQPELILRPLVFSILIFLMIYLKQKKPLILDTVNVFKKKDHRIENSIIGLLFILLVSFGLTNFFKDFATLWPYLNPIPNHLISTYSQKYDYIMKIKYGNYYEYTQFVKNVVSDNSSLLLPPQQNPWQYEGNQRLARYFLYPRTLYSAHKKNLPKSVDFIEIAWGSTDFAPKGDETYGWPKNKIKAEKVYIYDFDTNDYKIYNEDYEPEKFLKPGVYGLIKTK